MIKGKEKRGKQRTLNNMKVSLAAEERIIEALRARVQKQEKQIVALRQLTECMDAIIYRIAERYGDHWHADDNTFVGWAMKIRTPDVSLIKPGTVQSEKIRQSPCGYKAYGMCEEACDGASLCVNAPGDWLLIHVKAEPEEAADDGAGN